jgi:hypothetical protein
MLGKRTLVLEILFWHEPVVVLAITADERVLRQTRVERRRILAENRVREAVIPRPAGRGQRLRRCWELSISNDRRLIYEADSAAENVRVRCLSRFGRIGVPDGPSVYGLPPPPVRMGVCPGVAMPPGRTRCLTGVFGPETPVLEPAGLPLPPGAPAGVPGPPGPGLGRAGEPPGPAEPSSYRSSRLRVL